MDTTTEIGTTGGACWREMKSAGATLIWALVAAAALIASSALLRASPEMSGTLRAVVALAPVVPFAAMFLQMVRSARRMDELHVRIQMEALSTTLLVSLVAAVGWGQLQKAGLVAKGELSDMWPLVVAVYFACFGLATRRYR